MKKILLLYIFLFSTSIIFSQMQNSPPSIVPRPMRIEMKSGQFCLSSATKIYANELSALPVATLFAEKYKIDKLKFNVKTGKPNAFAKNTVFFSKVLDSNLGTEGYHLRIGENQIVVLATTDAGLFYGMQTLLQMLPDDIFSPIPLAKRQKKWLFPCADITDVPRYGYRGLHLDVSRHFQPVNFIKKYIDLIALHKMNTFHWHLTDDQGWRIEIKKYPKLTTVGANRRETRVGHAYSKPEKYDGKPYGGFYTQTEIKEIVAYAATRFVTIVPEIEMPGHALAALAAYPELSCDPSKKYEVATTWGVFDDVFCPTDTTFRFLEDVLTEVMALFPSKYIHIGGDECPKNAWQKSAFCQDLIKKENLKDEHGLQSYFIKRIEKFLNKNNRSLLGWDEILEGGIAPNATIMSWRGTEGGVAAAKSGHEAIMTPTSHCYFDYFQADPETEPLAIGGFLPLEKVYAYEPTPVELSDLEAEYILGAQANVWTEYMKTPSDVEYMVFPRVCALSEVLWSPKTGRDFKDFTKRLNRHFGRLSQLKTRYSTRFFDVKMTLEKGESAQVSLQSVKENAEIRFTVDGSEPKFSSPLYQLPFKITEKTTVKAAIFELGKQITQTTRTDFFPHLAFGLDYSFDKKPTKTYDSGEKGLTNGLRGDAKNFAQWVGFEGDDMVLTLDLGMAQQLKEVKLQFLNRPDMWIFAPDFVTLSASENGVDWLDINRADFAHDRDDQTYTKEAVLQFSEYTRPKRFLKVYVKNIGNCPNWHVGKGKKAWLFVDEVLVF